MFLKRAKNECTSDLDNTLKMFVNVDNVVDGQG
jgi:hypothetical protein